MPMKLLSSLLLLLMPCCMKAAYHSGGESVSDTIPAVVIEQEGDEATLYFRLVSDSTAANLFSESEIAGGEDTLRYCFRLDSISGTPGWLNANADITKAVFMDCFLEKARPTSTYCWFYGLRHLTTITGIDRLNTSEVTDMSFMFAGCTSLTSLVVSQWDTHKVTNLWMTFSQCSKLKTLDVSRWDTRNVTNMGMMFFDCASIAALDISGWDMKNVSDAWRMFDTCSSLKILNLGGNDFANLPDSTDAKYQALYGVGKADGSCTLVVSKDFDRTLLGTKRGNHYAWLEGTFPEPIVGETVVIDSAGFATYAPKGDIDLTKNTVVAAYTAHYDDTSQTIYVTPTATAPARTPLIFTGTTGMQILVAADDTPSPIADNDLRLCDTATTADGSQWLFIEFGDSLASGGSHTFAKAGFAKAAAGTTLRTGTIYLLINGNAPTDNFIAISEQSTSIRTTTKSHTDAPAIYDLGGRKLPAMRRGINIVRRADGTAKKIYH